MSWILTLTEVIDHKITPFSKEALALGNRFKKEGYRLATLILGDDPTAIQDQLAPFGVERMIGVTGLSNYSALGYRDAIQKAQGILTAELIISGSSACAREYLPMAAAQLDAAMVSEVTHVTLENKTLKATRTIYTGKLFESIQLKKFPVVLMIKPKSFDFSGIKDSSTPEVESISVQPKGAEVIEIRKPKQEKLDVQVADVIVSGGRGLGAPENFSLLEDLASLLHAAVGASRAVVDLGWRPHSDQVGQTGKLVAPKVYIAVAISGAIQHVVGMAASKIIFAVNKDPEAPIFKKADYGIVEDYAIFIPKLIQKIKESL